MAVDLGKLTIADAEEHGGNVLFDQGQLEDIGVVRTSATTPRARPAARAFDTNHDAEHSTVIQLADLWPLLAAHRAVLVVVVAPAKGSRRRRGRAERPRNVPLGELGVEVLLDVIPPGRIESLALPVQELHEALRKRARPIKSRR